MRPTSPVLGEGSRGNPGPLPDTLSRTGRQSRSPPRAFSVGQFCRAIQHQHAATFSELSNRITGPLNQEHIAGPQTSGTQIHHNVRAGASAVNRQWNQLVTIQKLRSVKGSVVQR